VEQIGIILVKNKIVKGYADERRLTVEVRKQVSDRSVVEELQGMLRKTCDKTDI